MAKKTSTKKKAENSQLAMENQLFIKPTAKSNTIDIYYLQLHIDNIADYFNYGIIFPLKLEESEIYKTENRKKDILSRFSDCLILSKKIINHFDETQVLVELYLKPNETTLTNIENIYCISDPIPVSRIKSLFFQTMSVRNDFYSSVKTFPDCFIPEAICKVLPENIGTCTINLDDINLGINNGLQMWKNKLDVFDKLLGLYAFVKNTGIFYAEKENVLNINTTSYFSILHLINDGFTFPEFKENGFYKSFIAHNEIDINTTQRYIFKQIIDNIYQNKQFNHQLAIEILGNAFNFDKITESDKKDLNELYRAFEQLKSHQIAYQEVIKLANQKNNIPVIVLAFLAKFGNKSRQHTDKQSVRISFIKNEFNFSRQYSEYILSVLGFYYGYKNLIRDDTNYSFTDSYFQNIAIEQGSIKFKLDSFIDRFIIESVFQFAKTEKPISDSLVFLNFEASQKPKYALNKTTEEYEYRESTNIILGEKVYSIRRIGKLDIVFEQVANSYPETINSDSYLFSFLSKIGIDKSLLLEILKKNSHKFSIQELEKITQLDLIFGQILHELEITDVAVGILYPSEKIQQIFQSEIIESVRNHPQTQISKSILMGYTNDIIRREVLNYGKADFNSAYKNLSSDDIVALYCYFNMRKHYFSSYAVFLKMFASLQIIFENEQLTPIFIDLGCGPLTSGLALADLYNIQTGKKLKFSYIGIDIANSMLRKAQKFSEVPDLFHEDARFHFFKNWNDISDSLFDDLMNENNPILLNASYLFANIDKVVAEDLARFVNKLVEIYKDVHIIFQNPNRTDRNIQYDNFKELISFKMVDSKVEKMFYKTQPNSFSEPTSEDVYYEILSLKS